MAATRARYRALRMGLDDLYLDRSMKRSPLKPMSKKRKLERNKYMKLAATYLLDHPKCQACKTRMATQIHHKKGRGPYYLAVETWIAVCNICHSGIHANPKISLENGWIELKN